MEDGRKLSGPNGSPAGHEEMTLQCSRAECDYGFIRERGVEIDLYHIRNREKSLGRPLQQL